MTELRVGVMDYAAFKDRTVAVARGVNGFAKTGPTLWFADPVAVGHALVAGMMEEAAGRKWGRMVVVVRPAGPAPSA